eukprot:2893326-Prymnesium_polylepis.1
MAATSTRGTTAYLHQSELRSLLRRANASANISNVAIEEALLSIEQAEEQIQLPQWLMVACLKQTRPYGVLDARQVTGMLLGLCCSSKEAAQLFETFSSNGRMSSLEWRSFVRSEQLRHQTHKENDGGPTEQWLQIDDEQAALARADEDFERASRVELSLQTDATIGLQEFTVHLMLSVYNDAVFSAQEITAKDVDLRSTIVSQQSRSRSSISARYAFDCFLSHNWGADDLGRSNHTRVCRIKQLLEAEGLRCWLDEEQMHGDINSKMTSGIEDSSVVIVFITSEYLKKAAGEGAAGADDSCKTEFDFAVCSVMQMHMSTLSLLPARFLHTAHRIAGSSCANE